MEQLIDDSVKNNYNPGYEPKKKILKIQIQNFLHNFEEELQQVTENSDQVEINNKLEQFCEMNDAIGTQAQSGIGGGSGAVEIVQKLEHTRQTFSTRKTPNTNNLIGRNITPIRQLRKQSAPTPPITQRIQQQIQQQYLNKQKVLQNPINTAALKEEIANNLNNSAKQGIGGGGGGQGTQQFSININFNINQIQSDTQDKIKQQIDLNMPQPKPVKLSHQRVESAPRSNYAKLNKYNVFDQSPYPILPSLKDQQSPPLVQ